MGYPRGIANCIMAVPDTPPALRSPGRGSRVGGKERNALWPRSVYLRREREAGIVASRAHGYRRRAQQCLEMARTFGDRSNSKLSPRESKLSPRETRAICGSKVADRVRH